MLPLAFPHVGFTNVVAKAVIGGVLLIGVETVNVHPKLFVRVITGVLVVKPETVCPDKLPAELAKPVIVCPGPEVFVTKIIPLFCPHVAFVKDNVAEGFGLTTTVVIA
jgi:hypothetical protein